MKVIKRNGDSVEFDQNKISIAIGKANKEVCVSKDISVAFWAFNNL